MKKSNHVIVQIDISASRILTHSGISVVGMHLFDKDETLPIL